MDYSDNAKTSLNVLVLGLNNVGKTKIIRHLREIGTHVLAVEQCDRNIVDGEKRTPVERLIFQEVVGFKFPSFQKLAIVRSDAFVLTYAVDDAMSFDYATNYIKEIRKVKGQDVPIFVAGNKADIDEPEVDPASADYEVTMNFGCPHVDVCALDVDGVKDLFSCLLGHLGQYLVTPRNGENFQQKKQSLRKKLSDYFRKKLSRTN